MSVKFEDDKFLVLPTKYIQILSMTMRGQLTYIANRVQTLRQNSSRGDHPGYYVCSRDEPYAEDVLNEILRGEERKTKQQERRA